MWSWADRIAKAVADVTVGTVIVLVHVAMADRQRHFLPAATPRRIAPGVASHGRRDPARMSDGSATGSVWPPRSQLQSAELDFPTPRRSSSW
jgi:hypothetical protein